MSESMNGTRYERKSSHYTMQTQQKKLQDAKLRKDACADFSKQLRLAGDYMWSLRKWVGLANNNKTLKARKAALAGSLNSNHMLINRAAAINCCEWQLVNDSCQSSLRGAISWASAALGANTFEDWDECLYNAEACIADAVVQLEVAHNKMKALWKSAKTDTELARWFISKCAKDILKPVALGKATKIAIMTKNIKVGNCYQSLEPINQYMRVSASAMAEWSGMQNVALHMPILIADTKARLQLIRTTRTNALKRASMFNDRKDYLARLPVYRTGTIDGRNWFVGSI